MKVSIPRAAMPAVKSSKEGGGGTVGAKFLGEQLQLPVLSKDGIKELLYDTVGFRSRAEKVRLGTAAMDIIISAHRQPECFT